MKVGKCILTLWILFSENCVNIMLVNLPENYLNCVSNIFQHLKVCQRQFLILIQLRWNTRNWTKPGFIRSLDDNVGRRKLLITHYLSSNGQNVDWLPSVTLIWIKDCRKPFFLLRKKIFSWLMGFLYFPFAFKAYFHLVKKLLKFLFVFNQLKMTVLRR